MILFKEFAAVIFKVLNLVQNVLWLDFQKIRQALDAIKILGLRAQEFFVYADFVFCKRMLPANNAVKNFLCH